MMNDFLLAVAVAVAATLYASVGHGGASAYLAILTLAGRLRPEIASTVLLMNIIVSSMAWYRFRARGHFDASLTGILLLFSAPAAFVAGMIPVAPRFFAVILGLALVTAAGRLILPDPRPHAPQQPQGTTLWLISAPLGTALGLLAGFTGVGGGVYLAPLLIFFGWKDTMGTAGVTAAFISINSLTGLLGRQLRGETLDLALLPLVVAAIAGGFFGSWWGAEHVTPVTFKRVLGVVLLLAGVKLLFGLG